MATSEFSDLGGGQELGEIRLLGTVVHRFDEVCLFCFVPARHDFGENRSLHDTKELYDCDCDH